MNKISLVLFLILCLLFLSHGLYQGVANGQWTSLTFAIIVIALGAYSMLRKKRK
ncbi:hypothetical protein [Halobacillus trueperi]|uniref:hypothetical protein n=1 Tax=Halobacillus trueperi TaxID=156205 RepID=UPI00142E6160|nr:hypothetical protein [Halobacillus trueperi]